MTAYAMTSPTTVRPLSFEQGRPRPRPHGPRRDGAVAPAGMRPTRSAIARRRAVLVMVLIAVIAVLAPRAIASGDDAAPVAFDTHTVAQGETLWEIAAGLAPVGVDVQDVVADIQTLNAMSGSGLRAGEQILLPEVG